MNKQQFIKRLIPYAKRYMQACDNFENEVKRIEKDMNQDIQDERYALEFHATECGWLIGEYLKEDWDKKRRIVHDGELLKEIENESRNATEIV